MQDENCIFCKIAAGKIPAKIIIQDSKSMAFLDAFPLALGHVLVIPKSHYAKIQDMEKDDSASVFETVRKVVPAVESALGVSSTTIAIHNGKEAGQEIPHLHIHIIPRKAGDGAGPVHSMFKKRPKPDEKEAGSILNSIKDSL